MLDTIETYNAAWSQLNAQLRHTEITEGLARAIAVLEQNQFDSGFIKDAMFGVERYVFTHPDDPSLFFRVQFNAKRMERFNGTGITAPPPGVPVAHGGCFLCRDNVHWQQRGAEFGYELDVNGKAYNVWMNPFPLMPGHVVIASAHHETQDWAYRPGINGIEIKRLIGDLIELAARMPGCVGFYNGVDAGASIGGHLHYQFFRRLEEHPVFPLEARLASRRPDNTSPVIATDYPLPVVKWSGAPQTVADAVTQWIADWAARNVDRLFRLTANIIVTADEPSGVTVYFVPRDQARPRGDGMSGLIGGLEILGELVFSSAEEKNLLDTGKIDYFVIENMLHSVRTPLFADAETVALSR